MRLWKGKTCVGYTSTTGQEAGMPREKNELLRERLAIERAKGFLER